MIMHPALVRAGKIAGLFTAATAVVLIADFLFSLGVARFESLPWSDLVSDELGSIGERVEMEAQGDLRNPVVRSLWPVEREGGAVAVVVFAMAPGYRSRIGVAVTVASDGAILAEHVVTHGESAYVGRMLDVGGSDASSLHAPNPDALSGATITAEGVQSARGAAVAAGRTYIEEQR